MSAEDNGKVNRTVNEKDEEKGTPWNSKDAGDSMYRAPYQQNGRPAWLFRIADKASGKAVAKTLIPFARALGHKVPDTLTERQAVKLVEKLAADSLRAHLESEADPTKLPPKETPIGEAFDLWLADAVLKETTRKKLKKDVELYKIMLAGLTPSVPLTTPVHKVRMEDWKAFIKAMEARNGRRWNGDEVKKLSGTTLIKHCGQISTFLHWCTLEEQRFTRANLMKPLIDRGTNRRKRYRVDVRAGLDEERDVVYADRVKILAECKDPNVRLGCVLLMQQGLRLGNVEAGPRGLLWGDIDLTNGSESLSLDAGRTKNKMPYWAPLHPESVAALHAELRRLEAEGNPFDKAAHVVTFADLGQQIRPAIRRAKLSCRCHDFRHAFKSALLLKVPGPTLECLMGHKVPGVDGSYRAMTDEMRKSMRDGIACLDWVGPKPAGAAQKVS